MHKFKGKKEQIKLVLDMSNDGPTFKMLENLMAATAGGKSGKGGGGTHRHYSRNQLV